MIFFRTFRLLHTLLASSAMAFTGSSDDSGESLSGCAPDTNCCMDDPSRDPAESLAVGGQAIMEGVMMRSGAHLAMAVRKPDGEIAALKRPWFTLFSPRITRKKWIRGFPVLAETMVNGVKALNKSAELAAGPDEAEQIKPWQMTLTLLIAVGMALFLFVVVPHLLTMGLTALAVAGKVEGVSFHIWDGLLKFLMFLGYIILIGRVEEIRRVFQYHGAEHKSISAYEQGENPVSPASASGYSRLHPRCGTTFLLFVLVISIIIHMASVPALLYFWTPTSLLLKHSMVLVFKFFLIIPISAMAYEAIRAAAYINSPLIGGIVRSPGLLLQLLTTREPDTQQLEVALVALKEALGDKATSAIETPSYVTLESD